MTENEEILFLRNLCVNSAHFSSGSDVAFSWDCQVWGLIPATFMVMGGAQDHGVRSFSRKVLGPTGLLTYVMSPG